MALSKFHKARHSYFGEVSRPATVALSSSPIHDAAGRGDLEEVRTLVQENSGLVSSKDSDGATPLHWAVCRGHKEVVEFMLANSAEVEARDGKGETPLKNAADRSRLGSLEILLAHGADPNAKASTGETPLHQAARQGHLDVTDLLLRGGADVHAKDGSGLSPLHLAAQCGNTSVAQSLLTAGAVINERSSDGRAALHHAASEGQRETVKFLLANGSEKSAMPTGCAVPVIHSTRAKDLTEGLWGSDSWGDGYPGIRALVLVFFFKLGVWIFGGISNFFVDEFSERSTVPEMMPSKMYLAVASLVFGIAGLVLWHYLPLAGLPVTIAGYFLGRAARVSPQRGLALAGMGLALLGIPLSIAGLIGMAGSN